MYCGSFCCCALRVVPNRFVGLIDLVRGFPFLPVGSFIACDVAGRLVGLTDPVRGFPFLPVGLVYSLWCCRSSRLWLWSCLSWRTSGFDLPCLWAVLLWPEVVTFLPPSGLIAAMSGGALIIIIKVFNLTAIDSCKVNRCYSGPESYCYGY